MDRLDYQKPEITIIHAEPERMLAASGRAAYLGCYTVHATMYMDIPDPITENENNQSK